VTATAASLLLALAAVQDGGEYRPFVAEASDEAAAAARGFQLPPGATLELWAAEPRLANPVTFALAYSGEVYVGETFRHHAGVTDIRDHMDWLDDDLACRSVEDRVAMFRKHLGEEFASFEREHERVRVLRDRDGDGRADHDTVFADGFSQAADGIGAGLLAWRGQVYYTCIPDLWRLRDADGDGRAEERESLSTGYGIRVALLGHDLHGLAVGPDGRLYFSCGDRGFVVTTREGRRIENWATGGVLRCELDGSDLELFATGLRNPQELAFDERGDLFTVDNNSDGGDRARIVHVLQDSDGGWRQAYQWITDPELRGPWNQEKLWLPRNDAQPAYLLPPIANLSDGPSGLAYYPGTGFGQRFRGRFFLADFRGGASYSGIRSFALAPRGAGFALESDDTFLWKVLATDVDFGPDGSLWLLDWVEGWNKTGKGRIWRLRSEDEDERRGGEQAARFLSGGMGSRALDELALLLSHDDHRVRQEAQFELVARGPDGLNVLREAANASSSREARRHGIWGLGMAARAGDRDLALELLGLLSDLDPDARAAAAWVLGDVREVRALDLLVASTRDPQARVRLHACQALGRIGAPESASALIEVLRADAGADRTLAHAAAAALARCADPARLVATISDPSVDVRLAAVVALRRLAHLGLVPFLADPEPRVVAEAARAIYDGGVEGALPALASLIATERALEPPLARRVLAANRRLGGEARAEALARFAMGGARAAEQRNEALRLLLDWRAPVGRDPLTGEWWPVERGAAEIERAQAFLARLVDELAAGGIGDAPSSVVHAWLDLEARHGRGECTQTLAAWATDPAREARVRARCIERLGELEPAGLIEILRPLLVDSIDEVRAAALCVVGRIAPDEALPVVESALARGGIADLRSAYATLAGLATAAADERLARELARLEADDLPDEVALDLVLAAEARGEGAPAEVLRARTQRRAAAGARAPWLDSLHGGDAGRGEELFREEAELACLRCHVVGEGPDGPLGGRVGPDLRGVGARLTRLQLLESILEPGARIAEGYHAVQLLLDDDTLVEGRIEAEDAARIALRTSDDALLELEPARIVERRPALSAMPAGLEQFLDRAQMRDLIAYLHSL
jgi:quinoprotein glucose dehydrogenase